VIPAYIFAISLRGWIFLADLAIVGGVVTCITRALT
jgi:hypothetical protein